MIPAYYLANRGGIPRVESVGVSVTATEVSFSFRQHRFTNTPFAGLVILRIAQEIPTGTTTTLPVRLGTVALKTYGGEDVTVADIAGTGIYLAYYDNELGYAQLIGNLN